MSRYTGKTCRLLAMIGLTASFFLVEIIVGYITNSLALVGDSYHMLSDVVALLIGFASVRISKWQSHKNTFGWARAEVLGALVNAVFLIALCFTIFVEALQRMFHNEKIKDPILLLIVGSVGLAVNLVGLVLFGTHSHSHGGHGHSHGGGASGHSHHHEDSEAVSLTSGHSHNGDAHGHSHKDCAPGHTDLTPAGSDEDEEVLEGNITIKKSKIKSSAQLNMRGVFLHILGDALGSVIVIISALVVKFVEADWKHKVDPALSLALVVIILSTSIPLLRESSLILLQTVPTHIQVKDLKEKLVSKVDGVLDLHEFHIWQLAGNRIIATAHIRCQNLRNYKQIAEDVKSFFHEEGIHSTTVQPEFVEYEELKPGRDCVLECGPDKTCFPDTCCGKSSKSSLKTKSSDSSGSSNVIRQRSITAQNSAMMYGVTELNKKCLIDDCCRNCHRMKCCHIVSRDLYYNVNSIQESPTSENQWVGNLGHGISCNSIGSCSNCTGKAKDPYLVPLKGASKYSPYVKRTRSSASSVESADMALDENTKLLNICQVNMANGQVPRDRKIIPENEATNHVLTNKNEINRTSVNRCNDSLTRHKKPCSVSFDSELNNRNESTLGNHRPTSIYFSVSEIPVENCDENESCDNNDINIHDENHDFGANNNTLQQKEYSKLQTMMCGDYSNEGSSLPQDQEQSGNVTNTSNSNNAQGDVQSSGPVVPQNDANQQNNPLLQSRYLSVGQRPPLVRQDAIEIDETNNNA